MVGLTYFTIAFLQAYTINKVYKTSINTKFQKYIKSWSHVGLKFREK